MNGPLVYIAAPYSGEVNANTRRAMDVMAQLMDADIPCVCPHLSHFADLVNPRPYEMWMALDMELLKVCARVLRLSGSSEGADREVRYAAEIDIPVWFEDHGTVAEFIDSLRTNTELAAGLATHGTASIQEDRCPNADETPDPRIGLLCVCRHSYRVHPRIGAGCSLCTSCSHFREASHDLLSSWGLTAKDSVR